MRNCFFQSLNHCEAYLTKLRQQLKRKVHKLRERLKKWERDAIIPKLSHLLKKLKNRKAGVYILQKANDGVS